MGMKVTMEALEAKQEKLRGMAESILKLAQLPGDHGEDIVNMSMKAKKEAEELQAMAMVYEQQMLESRKPAKASKTITVELTDLQRNKIMEETGVRMETVQLKDDAGVWTEAMPTEVPPDIYPIALKQARSKKQHEAAEAAAKEQANIGLDALRAQNNPEMDKLVDKAVADPNFLGGLLQDK